jgi:hypothetical protein
VKPPLQRHHSPRSLPSFLLPSSSPSQAFKDRAALDYSLSTFRATDALFHDPVAGGYDETNSLPTLTDTRLPGGGMPRSLNIFLHGMGARDARAGAGPPAGRPCSTAACLGPPCRGTRLGGMARAALVLVRGCRHGSQTRCARIQLSAAPWLRPPPPPKTKPQNPAPAEALAALYEASGDKVVLQRLLEMVRLVGTRLVTKGDVLYGAQRGASGVCLGRGASLGRQGHKGESDAAGGWAAKKICPSSRPLRAVQERPSLAPGLRAAP